jgi:hypothetical protein
MFVSFFLNLAKNKSIEEIIVFHKLLFDNSKFPNSFGTNTKKNHY